MGRRQGCKPGNRERLPPSRGRGMRKVYNSDKSSLGFAFSIVFSLAMTGAIFCILPFTHIIAKPGKNLELRKASAADLPPPQEDETHTSPPEPEKQQQEAPPD